MTLPSTGVITASMINRELGRADNAPFSLNDPAVRVLAGKPSGGISFADLRGKSSEIVVNLTSRVAVCLQDLFSPTDWASDTKKRVVIPAGVEIGGDNLDWAIVPAWDATGQAGSWGGELFLDVLGVISGQAGAVNGGRGGNCIRAIFGGRNGQKLQLRVIGGTIRAGGGGGGRGGDGGGGFYDYTQYEPSDGSFTSNYTGPFIPNDAILWEARTTIANSPFQGYTAVWWGGEIYRSGVSTAYNTTSSVVVGDWLYERGSKQTYNGGLRSDIYYIRRSRSARAYTSGGAGGNGGNGVGYGIGASAGAWGAAGGTNAGAGGRGGDGGGWGAGGAWGVAGGNGNNGGGAGGAAGGAAGYAITGLGFVQIVQNTGSIVGQQA
ncbi:hypothetical protein BR10RB9215_C12142 [Brucella sp. 10RB9215]|uniref:hypothetical protein n=1 Tax=Brucella sp. 10RB9215 TaxID=1149953 RepID=UPI00090A8FCD|nr:hypothetical protein [Brucella sp. 10RB9215]SBW15291.1 hypothetical protein BR10RB9215_C12142 [Brucella sp. 10RB9215]